MIWRIRAVLIVATCLLGWTGGSAAQGVLSKARNTDQPIEISADSLEVLQDKQIAVFTGNVDATQGSIRLRADSLRVHYRQNDQPAAKRPAQRPGPQQQTDASGAISRIDASGKVFVSSPEETAQGDRGIYDVDKRVITLEGNVVLTRGKNVLRGQKATMNLDSGRSVMEGGRVRGLFVPQTATKP